MQIFTVYQVLQRTDKLVPIDLLHTLLHTRLYIYILHHNFGPFGHYWPKFTITKYSLPTTYQLPLEISVWCKTDALKFDIKTILPIFKDRITGTFV